ncbi:MAG: hypothetical protein R2815_03170 [Flavobacteriales bacterium]|nr:hypothetical protein [Flavobacteriales bacterium]
MCKWTWILLFCCVPYAACTSQRSTPVAGTVDVAVTDDLGLKPPSELALLMRTLAAHADSVKAALAAQEELPPFPKEAKTLFTATPTEGMEIDPITYPTFGKDYLKKLDALYRAERTDRAQAYNALVLGCANCHTTHCPGPMMRIKKMYVPLTE